MRMAAANADRRQMGAYHSLTIFGDRTLLIYDLLPPNASQEAAQTPRGTADAQHLLCTVP
jgi:hypothetical protein